MKNIKIIRNPLTYLISTIAFSYFFWILAILAGGIVFKDTLTTILFVIGGISPLLFGIIFFYINNSERERRKEFWIRIIDIKRIKAKWYCIIFGLNIAITKRTGQPAAIGIDFGGGVVRR